MDPLGVSLGRLVLALLCSASGTCRKVGIKTMTVRQAGLEALEYAEFRCAKGQGGVIDDTFMGVVFLISDGDVILRHSASCLTLRCLICSKLTSSLSSHNVRNTVPVYLQSFIPKTSQQSRSKRSNMSSPAPHLNLVHSVDPSSHEASGKHRPRPLCFPAQKPERCSPCG